MLHLGQRSGHCPIDSVVLLPSLDLLIRQGPPKFCFFTLLLSDTVHAMAPSFFVSLFLLTLSLFSEKTFAQDNGTAPDDGSPAAISAATVSSTILVLARDDTSAQNGATLGLQGYGIPFQVITVPQAGISSLPILNASATHGNYGGIVVVSEVGYNYADQYYSALTRAQWNQLYNYQTNFGVRMVRLDVFPTSDFGVVSLGGNVNDEPVVFTNVTGFSTAGLKS
jgi:hypothetical protein